jgi:REP element-mobilizing transposase RayT
LSGREPISVTLRFVEGLLSLRAADTHALLVRAMNAARRGDDFQVCAYSVQSNHVHLLVEARDEGELARGMNSLNTRIGLALNALWRRSGSVLAERYHSRVLRSPSEVRRALVYVLNNARKHGAWIAPWPDPYSSGPSFDGWRAPARGAVSSSSASARLDGVATVSSVARSNVELLGAPRTWLLAVGWRRLGLIDVSELPATARQGTETVA